MTRPLRMWTIYDHPSDDPQHFVARCWLTGPDDPMPLPLVIKSDSLADLREHFECVGLVCLARNDGDDPVIVETWL